MTLRLFPSLPDHTTKTVCSTEIKHAGLHDSQNKANKRIKSRIGHNLLISCKTVTEQRLKTRLEKSASSEQFVTIVNTIRGGGLSAQCALYKITDSEGWPGPNKQLTDNIFKGMTSLLVYFMQ